MSGMRNGSKKAMSLLLVAHWCAATTNGKIICVSWCSFGHNLDVDRIENVREKNEENHIVCFVSIVFVAVWMWMSFTLVGQCILTNDAPPTKTIKKNVRETRSGQDTKNMLRNEIVLGHTLLLLRVNVNAQSVDRPINTEIRPKYGCDTTIFEWKNNNNNERPHQRRRRKKTRTIVHYQFTYFIVVYHLEIDFVPFRGRWNAAWWRLYRILVSLSFHFSHKSQPI